VSRIKTSLDHKRIRLLIWLVLTVFVLLGYSLQSVAGTAYYSMVMQAYGTVSSPPVILQNGTTGTSTIYTNNTSAKVSVQAPTAWLNGWDKRVRITIDRNDVDADLFNFPLLVYLSNSSSGRNNDDVSFVFDELQNDTNRKKIAVTKSDGLTQCYVEIERWDYVSEKAWLWIKVPNISSKGNTNLYLYYDSSQPYNTAYVGDKGSTAAQNVWNTNFKGVWHLDEDPSGTSPQMRDSTSNNHNGTSNGNMTSGDQIAGKIDGSLDFDGTDDYINTTSNELKTLNNFTLSVWFKADSTTAPQHILWEGPASQNGWGDGSSPNSHEMHLTICKFDANNTLNFFYGYEESGGDFAPAVEIIMPFSDTTNWNHAVVVMTDAGTSPSAELFLNGVSQGTDTGTQTNRTAWDTNLRIGRPGQSQRYFDGMTDEVRILETAVSASWVKASYESERGNLLDFGSEERNIIDHVDNNTSDIGSPTDIGTHSNFTAQQYGPDSIYDTLTEADTGTGNITYENSAESYSAPGQSSHNFNYSLQKSLGNERLVVATVSWEDATGIASISSLTFGGTAMTKITNVTVGTGDYSEYISLWYLLDSSLPSSPGSYNIAVIISESIAREIYMAVAEYSGVKQSAPDDYDTHANTSQGNTSITLTAAANGSLVVAGVGEGGENVLTNTNNIVNLQEEVLTSSGSALGHLTKVDSGNITVGWNNLNTREGMAGAVWQPSNTNYELDLEVQWTNVSYTLAHEELCIKTGPFSGSEDLMVHAWNVSTSDWDWIMNLTASSWNNVSVLSYLTSSNFTIRFKGGNEINDPPQDSWNIDATQLYVWTTFETTYDYVLRVNNTVSNSWQIRLKKYADSNIDRLQNCTIYFHNSTDGTSSQIYIQNGLYINQTGPWYDLGDSETIYIAMTVQANSTATSYVYTYLEIRIPGTSTYAQYVITFEIT